MSSSDVLKPQLIIFKKVHKTSPPSPPPTPLLKVLSKIVTPSLTRVGTHARTTSLARVHLAAESKLLALLKQSNIEVDENAESDNRLVIFDGDHSATDVHIVRKYENDEREVTLYNGIMELPGREDRFEMAMWNLGRELSSHLRLCNRAKKPANLKLKVSQRAGLAKEILYTISASW